MNLTTSPSTPDTLPEKIEAMALAPGRDPATPHDYFLFAHNDNDFETSQGHVNGLDFIYKARP